ncbi:YqaJ viral recombinase family protein [Streptobacillus moniliformis]|uniref:YqaJ viral recombinase family nuclease n=1 Tax=Streptobacillus moniliformis TaxID=34105 RepID=UPI0007E2FCDB|nr:YqaJ viral recombinase family protein [Streptobacillus moniliformis]
MTILGRNEIHETLINKETEILDYTFEDDWLKLRQKGIGGSDIGALLGLNKYKSVVDVYLDKVEGKRVEDNSAMEWGRNLEPVIRSYFEEKNKSLYDVYLAPFSLKFGILRANLDGIIFDKEKRRYGILEIKTANIFTAKEWKDGKVPPTYYSQVMHYMTVTGFDYAIIAVLIGGSEYKEFYIERNEEEIQIIQQVANNFWKDYVIPNQIPSPDGSDAYSEYQKELLEKYETYENRIEIEREQEIKLEELENIKDNIKDLERKAKEIEQDLMNEIIENKADLMVGKNFKVKLVTQNRMKIAPEFKKECSELINEYKTLEQKYKVPYKINFLRIDRIGE